MTRLKLGFYLRYVNSNRDEIIKAIDGDSSGESSRFPRIFYLREYHTTKTRTDLMHITTPESTNCLSVGDLVWTKPKGWPWWPAMISRDPQSGTYCQAIDEDNTSFMYFVQYFGPKPSNGWTDPSKEIIPYEGINAFLDNNNDDNKNEQEYVEKKLQELKVAVIEAELARAMSHVERVKKFTFLYVNPDGKSPIG